MAEVTKTEPVATGQATGHPGRGKPNSTGTFSAF